MLGSISMKPNCYPGLDCPCKAEWAFTSIRQLQITVAHEAHSIRGNKLVMISLELLNFDDIGGVCVLALKKVDNLRIWLIIKPHISKKTGSRRN